MLKYSNMSRPVYKEDIVKAIINSSWATKSRHGRNRAMN
jgi:hypothetical protein